jgi:hypothetical protein
VFNFARKLDFTQINRGKLKYYDAIAVFFKTIITINSVREIVFQNEAVFFDESVDGFCDSFPK